MPAYDPPMSWRVEHRRGGVDELHHLEVDGTTRSVLILEVTRPALALGSTQSMDMVAPGVSEARDVTRRHSGGGLVLLDPDDVAWVDVVIPAGDPLWRVDVGEAFVWLGRAWAEAVTPHLSAVDAPPIVHRGGPVHADLGRAVCFAGVGSGEVVVGDRKLVGMSQRRTRDWARFQCLVHRSFDAEASFDVLAPAVRHSDLGERLRERLAGSVATVRDPEAVVDELLEVLDRR